MRGRLAVQKHVPRYGARHGPQAEEIRSLQGSLRVLAPPDFFASVIGYRGAPKRYYVHGDEVEGQPGKYFCRQCEDAVGPAHFESAHPGETEVRYVDSVGRWERRPARSKMNLRRPSACRNYLEDVVKAAQAEREAARSPFHVWILQQEGRGDPIGDLAESIRRDRKFPTYEASRSALRAYISRAARSWGIADSFDEAWKEFGAAHRRSARAAAK